MYTIGGLILGRQTTEIKAKKDNYVNINQSITNGKLTNDKNATKVTTIIVKND